MLLFCSSKIKAILLLLISILLFSCSGSSENSKTPDQDQPKPNKVTARYSGSSTAMNIKSYSYNSLEVILSPTDCRIETNDLTTYEESIKEVSVLINRTIQKEAKITLISLNNYLITNLLPNTFYTISTKISCAKNTNSKAFLSNTISQRTKIKPLITLPNNMQITATDITDISFNAYWNYITCNAGNVASYKTKNCVLGTNECTENNINTTNYIQTGLTAETTYSFEVEASCSDSLKESYITKQIKTEPIIALCY